MLKLRANQRDRAINKAHDTPTTENVANAKQLRNQVTAIKRDLMKSFYGLTIL